MPNHEWLFWPVLIVSAIVLYVLLYLTMALC